MGHPISRVHVTSEFEKSFRRLPANIQYLAEKKISGFGKTPLIPVCILINLKVI